MTFYDFYYSNLGNFRATPTDGMALNCQLAFSGRCACPENARALT